MELKFVPKSGYFQGTDSSNRTFMELKYLSSEHMTM